MNAEATSSQLPRVLHVTTAHSALDNRIYYKEVRSLTDAGYIVQLATTIDTHEIRGGVALLPLGAGAGRQQRWRRLIRGLRAFLLMLRSPQGTIVHIHDPELLIAAFVPALMGRKLVYDVHEFYAERIMDSSWVPRFFRRPLSNIYRITERVVLRSFAGVVIVSETMRENYRRVVGDRRVALVRNYPNVSATEKALARNSAHPLGGQPYILHTGGASLLRAFHVMISAVEYLREQGCRWPVYNLGTIDLSGYDASSQASLLDRADRVDIRNVGLLPQAEAWAFVAHASIGFMPLVAVENNVRGLPNKLFEYLLFGVPVVATDMGEVGEIVRRTGSGLVFSPEDSEAAGVALWRVSSDEALRKDLAARATAAGAQFSFRTEAETLVSLYRQIE